MGSIVFTMLSNANISSNRTRCSKHFFLLSQNHHVRTPLQQQLTHTLGKLDSVFSTPKERRQNSIMSRSVKVKLQLIISMMHQPSLI